MTAPRTAPVGGGPPGDPMDPEVARGLEVLPQLTYSAEILPALRSRQLEGPPLSRAVMRQDHMVPGDPPVPIRVHRAVDADGPRPCLLSMHGGGFILGSVDYDDPVFDRWCPTLGVVGVSVDYRLAPENPYPAALEDCYRTLRWIVEHAAELGVDTERIGVCGNSAGGGLAAALALLARDRGEVSLDLQLLSTPMLDDRQITASSRQDGLAVWSRESNTFAWQAYLGDRHGTDQVPYLAAPARAEDLSGLPPALVSVGTLDGFRDESVDYARRLSEAGVAAEVHMYSGVPHGYQIAGDTEVGRRMLRHIEEWILGLWR